MSSEFDFSTLEVQEIPVVSPEGKHFTLKEATGKAAKNHRNAILASTQFASDGKGRYRAVGLKDLASAESKFVAECLWDEKGNNPTYTLVESWPARIQKALYQKAKAISNVEELDVTAEQLKRALQLTDSPVSLEDFNKWIVSLDEEDFRLLKRAFVEDDVEESPKNSQESSENGSS